MGRKPLLGVPPYGCRQKRPARPIALECPKGASLPIGMETALSMVHALAEVNTFGGTPTKWSSNLRSSSLFDLQLHC